MLAELEGVDGGQRAEPAEEHRRAEDELGRAGEVRRNAGRDADGRDRAHRLEHNVDERHIAAGEVFADDDAERGDEVRHEHDRDHCHRAKDQRRWNAPAEYLRLHLATHGREHRQANDADCRQLHAAGRRAGRPADEHDRHPGKQGDTRRLMEAD